MSEFDAIKHYCFLFFLFFARMLETSPINRYENDDDDDDFKLLIP
jgi:hypothetical protein